MRGVGETWEEKGDVRGEKADVGGGGGGRRIKKEKGEDERGKGGGHERVRVGRD